MNIILTSSRTGSTVFAHSLNAALGNPLDVDVALPTPDTRAIGEHLHPATGWTLEQLRRVEDLVPATKISVVPTPSGWSPKFVQFQKLAWDLQPRDKVLFYRREWSDWVLSQAKYTLTKKFHVHTQEEWDEVERQVGAIPIDHFEQAISRARRVVAAWEQESLRILENTPAQVEVVWYDKFIDDPASTLQRTLKFFGLYQEGLQCRLSTPLLKLPNIQNDC